MRGAKFERRAHGTWIEEDREVANTLQCCHCGHHFLSIRGSGARRGWCMLCNAVTCGGPGCETCLPFEKRLDLYEKGKINVLP